MQQQVIRSVSSPFPLPSLHSSICGLLHYLIWPPFVSGLCTGIGFGPSLPTQATKIRHGREIQNLTRANKVFIGHANT
eukprot:12404244-Karenia_brevis.AAC.1